MMTVEPATPNGEKCCGMKQQDDKKGSGWLSKRTQFTHRWKPAWFQLKDTQLVYGAHEEKPQKAIELLGASVQTLEGAAAAADGTFGWSITLKDSTRTFYLRACSEAEQTSWMVAICQAQICSNNTAHGGPNACVLQ